MRSCSGPSSASTSSQSTSRDTQRGAPQPTNEWVAALPLYLRKASGFPLSVYCLRLCLRTAQPQVCQNRTERQSLSARSAAQPQAKNLFTKQEIVGLFTEKNLCNFSMTHIVVVLRRLRRITECNCLPSLRFTVQRRAAQVQITEQNVVSENFQ